MNFVVELVDEFDWLEYYKNEQILLFVLSFVWRARWERCIGTLGVKKKFANVGNADSYYLKKKCKNQ